MSRENHSADQSLSPEDDGANLLDIINFLQNGWKVIAITSILGLGIGGAYAFLAPSKFQAEVIAQGALVAGQLVEPPAVSAEKLKQPTYYSQETLKQCDLKETPNAFSALSKDLKPTLSKTAPVINLSYTAKSPEIAKACLESVLADIGRDQQRLAEPLIKIRGEQLANTKIKLALAEEAMTQLGGKKLSFDIPDQKFSSSALLYSIILSKQNEISDLRKTVETQTVELSIPQTQPAAAVTPIYAPDMRVSPKRSAAIVGGLFGGALLGILCLLGQQSWKKIKPRLRRHSI